MSSWSGGGKRRAAGKGWRNKSDSPDELSHSWQAQAPGRPRSGRSSRRRWQSHWLVYSTLGAALLGLFLYVLLIRPAKTPVLLAMGVEYAVPAPPNQWVQEDREALSELDETLAISEITGSLGGDASEGWKSLQNLLSEHRAMRRGFRSVDEPLVIYFSMPGVVDEKGAPCLLPSGSSALDSQDWLRVEKIVDEIAKTVPAERPKLLILDSNQSVVNWKLGIVYNTFSERLKEFVDRCDVHNLAVLNSADAGQVSWCSPQLGGTAFGQFLRMGLAGAADYDSADPNGEVSVAELATYLRVQVGNWAKSNRDSVQTPILLKTSQTPDFDLTHALSRDVIDSYRKSLADVSKIEPSISIATMSDLWSMLDRLRELDIARYDPLVLARYECDLLRMEQMAYGGKAYKTEAERLSRDLKNRLEQAIDRAGANGFSLADQWAIANPDDAASTRITQDLNSLAMRRYFGQSNELNIKQSQEFFRALSAAVNGMQPQQSDFDPPLVQSLVPFADTQMLVAAHRLKIMQEASAAQYLRAVIDLKGKADQLAVPSILEDAADDSADAESATDESAVYPGDERAHYYVRLALADADRNRRLAQDALFVSSLDANRNKLLSEANKSLLAVAEIQEQVSQVLAIADRSFALTPYLAEWIGRDRGLSYPMANMREMDDLLRLVRDTQELSSAAADLRSMRQSPGKIAETANRLKVMAQSIDQRLTQYIDEFNGVCEQLGKAQVGAELLSFESVLASPLIRATLRRDLLTKRDVLAAELHKRFFSAASTEAVSAAAGYNVAEIIATWQRPPLLAILGETDDQSTHEDVLQRFEQDCWTARKSLSELKDSNVQGASSVDVAAGTDAFLDDRLALSGAERRERAAASLWFEPPALSPVTRLRRFDLQQLFVWQAERALDDFWHTVAEPNAKTIKDLLAPAISSRATIEPPGFADTAAGYLTCAEQINSPVTQAVNMQIDSVKKLVDERRLASQFGLEQMATSRPVLDSPSDVEVDVVITPHPKGSNLPVGTATIYLADEANQLASVASRESSWGQIPLPIAEGKSISQTARARDVKTSSLDSVVFFRGRQYRQQLEVNSLGGAVVQYEPPQYDTQSITLFGDQPNPPSVVFVLDCSYSMVAPIETEVPGAPMQPQMKVAKTALETMLNELAGRQGAAPRVGVWFFGHRVGWISNEARTTWRVDRRQEAAKGPIPNDLAPAEDVERILPLGLFGAQEFGLVSSRLADVTYHGLTPVNLSIVRALEEFSGADDDYSKSIIVITDGENDQWHDTTTGFKPVRETSTNDVISAWNRLGKNIPIYIIGFGIPEDERGNAIREFQKIAEVSHGKVVTPNSGADLIDYLRKQLSAQGYIVAAVDGERTVPVTKDESTGEELPVELNTRVVIPSGDFTLPGDFAVEFQSLAERVTLEGGEALEMRVTREGDGIAGIPYDADVIDEAPLAGDSSTEVSSPILRVHRPRRNDDRVKFRFSVQDQDAPFTPRPRELWIEVTPDGSSEPYVYYDTVFEANTPVPVAGFTAANWPAGTDYARVRFWCGYQPTASLMTIRLADAPATDAGKGAFQAVPQVPGLQVRVELENKSRGEYSVLVEEQVAREPTPAGAIRVRLEISDKSLQPRLVSHRFDAANRVARHQFDFLSSLSRREFAERITVGIISEAALKKNCLHLGDANGLRVPIVDEDATLVPSASSSSF
jgi:hypothetical protein